MPHRPPDATRGEIIIPSLDIAHSTSDVPSPPQLGLDKLGGSEDATPNGPDTPYYIDVTAPDKRRHVSYESAVVSEPVRATDGTQPYQEALDAPVLSEAQLEAVRTVGDRALATVEQRYGTGYPDFSGGRDKALAFHGGHHTKFVKKGAGKMGDAMGQLPAENAIGDVAASAHDIVQLEPRGVMEQKSAAWLAGEMRARRLPETAVTIGVLAIEGTEPIFEGNMLVGQKVSSLDFPSKSAERVAMSVGCADMGELYAPTGPLMAHHLYREIFGIGPGDDPNMQRLLEFQRGQVQLVQSYRYPHPEGERVFGALRGKVVAYSEEVLRQLEQGTLDWGQLMAQDEAFRRRYS